MRKMFFVAVIAITGLASACGETADRVAATDEASPARTEDVGSSGGTSMEASCVETYSLDALKERDYAFDGTISSIEPATADGSDTAVFAVAKWFKGGEGATASKKGSFSVTTSAGGSERRVGDHLLVAGDDEFVWECGFTQAYDADVAAEWESTLSE